jgi:nucleoside 2-deoxyribosyltransferase
MIIYLAHPIDFAGENRQKMMDFGDHVRNLLVDAGCTVFSPALAWRAQPPMAPQIQRINIEALIVSDAALFIMPEKVHSLGVPFELGVAHAHSIPSVILRGVETTSDHRDGSALLAYLERVAIYGFDDVVSACLHVANLAQYRWHPVEARESQGDTTERTGE